MLIVEPKDYKMQEELVTKQIYVEKISTVTPCRNSNE